MELITPSPKEAVKLQKELAKQVIRENDFAKVEYIAGADVSNSPYGEDKTLHAAITAFSFPKLELIEQASHSEISDFPYIPGLLAFREAPVLIKALENVINKPDIIIVDGHGISHPRKLGIASHIGVLTGFPTIGCAKSVMVGKPEQELPPEKGSFTPLIYKNEVVGNLVRTRKNVSPVYVSTGHKITLEKATEIILSTVIKYRLPEPIRAAHEFANYIRIKESR